MKLKIQGQDPRPLAAHTEPRELPLWTESKLNSGSFQWFKFSSPLGPKCLTGVLRSSSFQALWKPEEALVTGNSSFLHFLKMPNTISNFYVKKMINSEETFENSKVQHDWVQF